MQRLPDNRGDEEEEEDNNNSLVHHVLVQKKTISQDHQVLPCTAALPLLHPLTILSGEKTGNLPHCHCTCTCNVSQYKHSDVCPVCCVVILDMVRFIFAAL